VIHVGFAPVLDASWLGGLNYYRNLFAALAHARDPEFEFALFTGYSAGVDWVPGGLALKVVRNALLEPGTPANILRRAIRRLAGRDVLLSSLVKDVQVLSHAGPLPRASRTRTVGWVPDLQHLAFPDLFSHAERRARRRFIAQHLRYCSVVLVSSAAARADLLRLPEAAQARIAVLRFVARPTEPSRMPDSDSLRKKYSLPQRYFYLPNQFWVHKNHRLVVDALRVARLPDACVVCTGDTRDYRRPGHYEELMATARGLERTFRVLGVVPQADAAALMRDAVAVINPSLFEGWSTTVEEAKSLGKRVLLSDIEVHREQAPERARYFDPRAPQDVAKAMEEALASLDPAEEVQAARDAAARLPERSSAFARTYLSVVRQALS
jgi:glycosyltransferase involved in cell wall biosynthesis